MNELNAPYNQLFNPQGDLTAEALWAYTHGGLTTEEMRGAQQHIATCEMCADAAEGAAAMTNKELYFNNINLLNSKIDERVEEKKKRVFAWGYQRLAIAALLLLLIGVSFVWFNYGSDFKAKTVASNQEDASKNKEPQLNKARTENEPPATDQGFATTRQDSLQASGTYSGSTNNKSVYADPSTTASGGTAPYTYTWTPSEKPDGKDKKSDVPAGENKAKVTDENGNSVAKLEEKKKAELETDLNTSKNSGAVYGNTSPASAPVVTKKSANGKAGRKQDYAAPSASGADRNKDAEQSEVVLVDADDKASANANEEADNIENQYPGSTDYIQHYIDSLRPNKAKSSRYPITVRLILDVKGEVSKVDFIHSPGINAREKGELEAVIKSMPFWKASKRRYSRPTRMSVKFNY